MTLTHSDKTTYIYPIPMSEEQPYCSYVYRVGSKLRSDISVRYYCDNFHLNVYDIYVPICSILNCINDRIANPGAPPQYVGMFCCVAKVANMNFPILLLKNISGGKYE